MTGLPDGRKSFNIGLAVQTQYRRVTDRQTDRHVATAVMHCVARVKSNLTAGYFITFALLLFHQCTGRTNKKYPPYNVLPITHQRFKLIV